MNDIHGILVCSGSVVVCSGSIEDTIPVFLTMNQATPGPWFKPWVGGNML